MEKKITRFHTAPTTGEKPDSKELKDLQQQVKDLRVIVNQLKDVLLTKDNWHSKIIKWIGKEVLVGVNPSNGINNIGTVGKLLWADRYHIGLEVADRDDRLIIRELLVNKGHIVFIREV